MKNTLRISAFAAMSALALAACSSAPKDEPASSTSAAPSESAAASIDYKACMVSDSGGFDDKSFNQAGFEGLKQVAADYGVEIASAESADENAFAPNIAALVADNCDLIITVGFLLSGATVEGALASPDVNFAIIDDSADTDFDGTTDAPNIKPLLFNTDEAAFLAGYAAAGTTKTGVVATFGGIQIPPVTIFMDGFLHGVNYYNETNGTTVKVLGWDGETGAFTGDFNDQTKGQSTAQGFIDQGADIILPVAGPVGLGAAAAAEAAGDTWIIGVDSDWTLTTEYSDIILTSIMKNMGPAVYDVVEATAVGDGFVADPYTGTLENGGVGIAAFAEGVVSDEILAAIEELQAKIISGEIDA